MARWDDGGYWDDGSIWDETDSNDFNLLWGIHIDWAGTGEINPSENEWYRCKHVEYEAGRTGYIRISGEDEEREATGFYYVEPGRGTLVLDNSDERYNPRNTSSPLYPNVKRGRLVQIMVKNGVLGETKYRFTGYIDDIERNSAEETVTLSLIDPLRKLAKEDANVSLQQNIKISEAMGLILDYINWPTALGRNIEATSDDLPFWWTQNRRALTELRDLADGDLGTLFCAGNGALTYYTRNHASSVAVSLTEADVDKDIKNPEPWDVICNWIEVRVKPLQQQNTGVLWQLINETPYIGPGETKEYFCPLSYNGVECPAINIVTPVATTDYTANTIADGSGTDKTANFTVTRTDLGIKVKLSVTNNGGAGEGAYLRGLQLRGDAIIVPNAVELLEQDDVSIETHGKLRFRYQSDWLQNLNVGTSIAQLLLLLLTNELGFVGVSIDSNPEKQFAANLFDNVQIDFARLNVSASMRLAYYKERWVSPNGQSVVTDMILEPPATDGGDYFRFDESELDVDAVFAP